MLALRFSALACTSIPEGINSGCDAEMSLQACRKVRSGLNKYGLQIAMGCTYNQRMSFPNNQRMSFPTKLIKLNCRPLFAFAALR